MAKIEKHGGLVFYLFCVLFTLLVFTPSQLSKGILHVFVSANGFAFAVLFFPVRMLLLFYRKIKRRMGNHA